MLNLEAMLAHLKLKFEGRPHSGIDDTRNIARIFAAVATLGAPLHINDSMERNRRYLESKENERRAREETAGEGGKRQENEREKEEEEEEEEEQEEEASIERVIEEEWRHLKVYDEDDGVSEVLL